MKRELAAFVAGLIFAAGLAIAGMTRPEKIIGFLDLANWDPSLMFVMVGAIGVHAIAYPLVRRRASPLFDREWHVPRQGDIDRKLIAGSAIFGIGWGLVGYCPGPAIVSLATGSLATATFVLAMVVGMKFVRVSRGE